MDQLHFQEQHEHHLIPHKKHNSRSIFYLIILGILAYITFYYLNTQLTHYLLPHQYGDYKSAIRIAVFMIVFITFGMNTACSVLLPSYVASKKNADTTGLFYWVTKNLMVICTIYIIAVIALHMTLSIVHHIPISKLYELHPFLLMLLFSPILGISYFLGAPLLARHKYISYSVPTALIYPLTFIVFIAIGEAMGAELNTSYLLILFVLSQLCATSVTALMCWHESKSQIGKKPSFADKSKWENLTTTSFFNILNMSFYASMGILLLEWLSPGEEQVGFYSVITILTSVYYVLTTPINTYAKPFFQEFSAEKKNDKLQTLWNQMLLIRLVIVVLILTCQTFFGQPLLHHFGQEYVHLYPILLIASTGYSVNYFLGGLPILLYYTGHHEIQTKIGIAQTITTCIAMVVSAKYFGAAGVIYSAIVFRFISFSAMAVVTRKSGIKPFAFF